MNVQECQIDRNRLRIVLEECHEFKKEEQSKYSISTTDVQDV